MVLPEVAPPQGNDLPFLRSGNLVFIAGQGPRRNGKLICKGVAGADVTLVEAQDAARLCAVNILTILNGACAGDLGRVVQRIRLAGLVRCAAKFDQQALVLNAASDLICCIPDEAGQHARIASGT